MESAVRIATREGGTTTMSAAQLRELGQQISGRIVERGDASWNDAIQVWNGLVAKTPALVIQPASALDVAAVVRFARAHRLLLSIRGGGHNIAGTALAEDGLTLDMARMCGVTVDLHARLAHVHAGCRLRDVDAATQAHGLATVLGFISEVGVAGLTLGGGLGYLTRRFGWTVDNLESVEIVTADGEIRTASRTQNADLFWAVRGGGGNFGVVTRFAFRLHEVGPEVYGGLIAWPFEQVREVVNVYRALTDRAPLELASWLVMLRGPQAPFVPPNWHGERLCGMCICYSGDLAKTQEVLAPLRTLGPAVFDLLQNQPYTQVQSYLDATEPKGLHYYWKTEYLPEVSAPLLSAMSELFEQCPIPELDMGVLHLGGMLNTHAPDDGCVGNRDARFVVGIKGMWPATQQSEAVRYRQWVREAWRRIRPFSTGATYVNFQTEDEDGARVRDSYGANFSRLLALKRQYDPDNLFRVNRNIVEG